MSRSALTAAAYATVALLVAFVVLSVVTSNSAWITWSVVPLLAALLFLVAAVRGETLGEAKRQRDTAMTERKAAERKARAAARTADK